MEFWLQTPATFVAVMKGRAHAAENRYKEAVTQAWHVEYFHREKRLKPLAKYLEPVKPKRPQTANDMLSVMRSIQTAGAPIALRRVE